jgi:hypothetical protein
MTRVPVIAALSRCLDEELSEDVRAHAADILGQILAAASAKQLPDGLLHSLEPVLTGLLGRLVASARGVGALCLLQHVDAIAALLELSRPVKDGMTTAICDAHGLFDLLLGVPVEKAHDAALSCATDAMIHLTAETRIGAYVLASYI